MPTRCPPGSTARLALQVTLPEGFHVQSNAPRDPSLIPTVLTRRRRRPASTVDEIVYPPATDFDAGRASRSRWRCSSASSRSASTLVVPATAPPGDLVVPARLRYQACDDTMCYAPATARREWTLRIVAAGRPDHAAADGDVFDGDRVRPRRKPAPRRRCPRRQRRAATGRDRRGRLAGARRLRRARRRTGGYLRRGDFLQFVQTPRAGVRSRACSRAADRWRSC